MATTTAVALRVIALGVLLFTWASSSILGKEQFNAKLERMINCSASDELSRRVLGRRPVTYGILKSSSWKDRQREDLQP